MARVPLDAESRPGSGDPGTVTYVMTRPAWSVVGTAAEVRQDLLPDAAGWITGQALVLDGGVFFAGAL